MGIFSKKKAPVLVQVCMLERDYKLIIRDYASLHADLVKLRFRKAQLEKEFANLKTICEEEKK